MWERQRTGIGRLSNKPSSLRYFRAKGRADMNIEVSEADFLHNVFFIKSLTPIFFVKIFDALRIGGVGFNVKDVHLPLQ